VIDISASGHYVGDCRDLLAQLPDACVQTCITSPPYWGLRDYGAEGQLGLERTPDEYVANMVRVFHGVRRALAVGGTLWLNLGDSYASIAGGYDETGSRGSTSVIGAKTQAAVRKGANRRPPLGLKPKDMVGIPWLVAFALRADGWYLRSDIIWHKSNAMPESVTDRPTKSHEHVFMLSKSSRYFYDADEIREPHSAPPRRPGGFNPAKAVGPLDRGGASQWERHRSEEASYHPLGRNARDVWTIATEPFDGAHFATMPPSLAERCVLAGSRPGDIVLDPFFGSGTTGMVAEKHGRRWIGFDLNPEYEKLQRQRTAQRSLPIGAPP